MSDDPLSAARAFWSAKLEVQLVAWRVAEAVKALPESPDSITVRRWNVGICREIWTAVRACGICHVTQPAVPVAARESSQFVTTLLRHCRWIDRDLQFDLTGTDRTTLLRELAVPESYFGTLAGEHGYPRWWQWGADGPSNGICPTWWKNPPEHVSPPLLVFEEDLEDVRTQSACPLHPVQAPASR
ncbi:hypothetical protein OH76DRAFT_1487728 [Lentinus brumalis]|uniref:Uncharacterized protein n=1 Tax=Lentinus brumalis TaxID=2498619 RepID=A0A371CTH3_9APHY|nr:hypothetical protein OH76DRAFT_1487728 [Polyporus brumalis]